MNTISHSDEDPSISPALHLREPASGGKGSPYLVRSVEKAFSILELLTERRPTLTVADVVESTGMNRATAYRFCRTLESLGYLETFGERSFRPGPKALLLGHAALQTHDLPQLARPYLEQLQASTGETVNMAVRHETEIVYLIRLKTTHFINIQLFEGSRLPVHATSMGKAILAFLPKDELERVLSRIKFEPFTEKTVRTSNALRRQLKEIRERGFAVNDEEIALGLKGAAAPILNHERYPVAAINVAVARPIKDEEIRGHLAPEVVLTAERIGQAASLLSVGSVGE